ncbi:MAG: hypothetical protein M1837_006109 [Sclerophora amabilis]|nr:MAG: hypothetical protein M1837_006109 [Sclerophora amabilis]
MALNGSSGPPRAVTLPRHRLRSLATTVYNLHPPPPPPKTPARPITAVCISDTHTTQPILPPGDLLLHAGDLSEIGSLAEIQAQLDWLSSQPHTHKVVIAGNHDVLFDPAFLEAYPERKYGNPEVTAADLDFGSVVYLQDKAVTLRFPDKDGPGRELKIYGSPTTPRYGVSAFQVPRARDVWSGTVPDGTDILLTHGPPWMHLDGALRSGCMSLAQEIARARPRLVVCGHIHVGYGEEEVRFDKVRRAYEGIIGGWEGHGTLLVMGLYVMWAKVTSALLPAFLRSRWTKEERLTKLVNAAVVGGKSNEYRNPPIVVHL